MWRYSPRKPDSPSHLEGLCSSVCTVVLVDGEGSLAAAAVQSHGDAACLAALTPRTMSSSNGRKCTP